MGFFKKVTKSFEKAVSSTVKTVEKVAKGDIKGAIKEAKKANPVTEQVHNLTGLSRDSILGAVGTAGIAQATLAGTAAAGAGGAAAASGSIGAEAAAGSAAGSAGSSILSTIFGDGDNNWLSNVLGSVVKGAVGIGADYLSSEKYMKDQKELNEQKFNYDKRLVIYQNSQNKKLADEAYQKDVAMWNMQNEYNSPAAQMQRLQQAGLNPNLVYGGGSVTGNTAGSAPSYNPPSYPQLTYPSMQAQKLDLARNVLGIFDDYQRIQNQALENQRENVRMDLAYQGLMLQKDRDERNFELAKQRMALAERQFNYARNKPDVYDRFMQHLGSLFDWSSDTSEKGFSKIIPAIYNWWHRPLKDDPSIPELF